MDEQGAVRCFVRNDGEILLYRADGVWDTPSITVGSDEWDPAAEIAEQIGLRGVTHVKSSGDDSSSGTDGLVYLFECDSRHVEIDPDTEWVHPPETLTRKTVPDLWAAYDHVRPRVQTVQDDRTHGSSWLSVRALEILRDEAALAVEGDGTQGERSGDGWDGLASLARRLRDSRPSMAVLENRINRTMFAAREERTVEAIQRAARGAVEQAVGANREAARSAADKLPTRVATISRSGTVETALRTARPAAVLVSESRPGSEGIDVAEALATMTEATVTTDAAFPFELAEWDADAVLIGADRIFPDGRILNKVGTRPAALGAVEAGIDCFVVAATDKIATDTSFDLEDRDPTELYDGPADLTVSNPTFDITPASAVTGVITEQGTLSPAEIEAVAESHQEWTTWDV
jgi:translation initiation factor 2B subunit (eIF-2B alpha/beta/delta family)